MLSMEFPLGLVVIMITVMAIPVIIALVIYLDKRFDFEGRKRMLAAFQQLAQRFNGNLIPEASNDLPEVTFGNMGEHILVQARRNGKYPDTRLSVRWPDPHLRCLISCGGFN